MTTISTAPDVSAYRVTDPSTGEVTETFATTTGTEITQKIEQAHRAFQLGLTESATDRASRLARAAELLRERAEGLAAIIAEEMGKPIASGIGEVEFCADIFDYYAVNGPELVADQAISVQSGRGAVIERRPLGTLLGIMPWNYPYYQVARFAAPNLVLGNSILLKPAESCPRSALAFQQLLEEAGFPVGAYQTVLARHDDIASIIEDPRVRGVSLTGSERAGAAVASTAGRALKKVVLELGGSDPYVILDSNDVEAAAAEAWSTRMENLGQACNSNKRIIVADAIHDEFVEALVALAKDLRPGDPRSLGEGEYPPMASRHGAHTLDGQVQDAVSKGASLHVGGILSSGPNAYYSPAVLTGVTATMRAYGEELFGPVLVVYRARDDAEALALANDSEFGLGAAVFSTDNERARRFAAQVESGMVAVNASVAEGAELPFGGIKRSGYGRELGPLGVDEFVNKRLVYQG